MIEIVLQIDEPFAAELDPERIVAAVRLVLDRFNPNAAPVSSGTVSVVITDTDTVQQLNHQFLDVNAPTDVLSFGNTPDPEFPLSETGHLGDIVIAYPVAQAQARAGGHMPAEEVILLAIHGALHLSDFDHDTPDDKESMWAAQRQVMAELGLVHVQPSED